MTATSVLHNTDPQSLPTAWGFSDTADRTVWPPSLSRDRKWPRVTKCTHSRVVGVRLESSVVIYIYVITEQHSRYTWVEFGVKIRFISTKLIVTGSVTSWRLKSHPNNPGYSCYSSEVPAVGGVKCHVMRHHVSRQLSMPHTSRLEPVQLVSVHLGF